MNKANNSIVQAKEEYTKELINIINEPMCEKFLEIYQNVQQNTKNKRDVIINCQYALRDIPLWNQALINQEVNKIRAKCEFLDDLVAAIFVTNVKILSSIKMGKEKQKIQVTMPKTDQFIHKIYSQSAQTLYNNPYIFSSQYEVQKRKSDILNFNKTSIEDTIRTSLPFRNILQNYLGNTVDSDSESDSESEKSHDETTQADEENEEDEEPSSNMFNENVENFENGENIENAELNNPNDALQETPNYPPVDDFFARPEQTTNSEFEQKTVPINNPPQTLQQQEPTDVSNANNPPMLFPDAANDPEV